MPMPAADCHTRPGPNSASHDARRGGTARLAAWLAVLAVVWLIALPWLSRRQPVAEELQRLEEQKIDPSAMYYTELEAMKPILQRLNAQQRSR